MNTEDTHLLFLTYFSFTK